MKLVMDTETTISPPKDWVEGQSLLKGGSPSPYLPDNKLVSVQYKEVGHSRSYCKFMQVHIGLQEVLDSTTLLIGFNLKFDLSWIRECGFKYEGELWDCQLVEYLLGGGRVIMPSLNEVAASYGLPQKKDKVKALWEAGINTDEIDRDILSEYGEYDVILTEQVYLKQMERLNEITTGSDRIVSTN